MRFFQYLITTILVLSGLAPLSFSAENIRKSAVPIDVIHAEDLDRINASQSSGNNKPIDIGVQLWMTSGHGEWEIEFGNNFITGRSKLEWEDIDAPVLVLHAEVPIDHQFSIGGVIGYGEYSDGGNTDSDWANDFLFSESKAEVDGDVTLGDLNVFYNIVAPQKSNHKTKVDVFIGFQYYKDDTRNTHGVQTVINETPINEPFEGLNSTYSFQWIMLRLGTRAEHAINDRVTIGGSLAALMLVDYEGEAYWNLRTDFRDSDPNFVQEANSGYGFEGKAAVKARIMENVYVDLGYWFMSLKAVNGTDTIYFADGTSDTTKLKSVKSQRQGFFAGLMIEL